MAPTIEQLEAMSGTEIRARYNEIAKNAQEGLEWYRHELLRRDVARQTRWLIAMTAVLTIATVRLIALELV